MTRLTEEMVIARTRSFDISSITKLNFWGSDLTDVSLLRRMWNVEVISLSINNISSLVDMQYCRNLKELYLRKNDIKDLNQICYLQELPRLKNLWLEDNPICTIDHYRMTVLRALPRLEKLDNQQVQQEEVDDARRMGHDLVHPEATQQTGSSGSPSPPRSPVVRSPTRSQEELNRGEEEYYGESEDESASRNRSPTTQSYKSELPRPAGVRHGESCPEQLSARQDDGFPPHPQSEDNRNANYHEDGGYPRSQSHHQYNNYDQCSPLINGESTSSVGSHERHRERPRDVAGGKSQEDTPGHPLHNHRVQHRHVQHRLPREGRPQLQVQGSSCSDTSSGGRRSRMSPRSSLGDEDHESRSERHSNQQLSEHPRIDISRRRPMTRNSNIISAVLCLIKELDIHNLEVVEMAVRNRIYELEEDNLS